MRRWAFVLLIVVLTTLLIFGGAIQLAITLLPQEIQKGNLYILGFLITYALLNGVVSIMQLFGKSPLDYLPQKTLREKDPQRFRLTRSRDAEFLLKQAKLAQENKEYEWAIAFAEALVQLKPSETESHEIIGESLMEAHQAQEAIKQGKILVSKQPLSHKGYKLLGDAYTELSQLEDARESYEEALKRATPTLRQFILYDLSKTYENLGMPAQAASAYKEFLEHSAGDPLRDYHANHLARLERLSKEVDDN